MEYEKLLEKAYSELPEKALKSERFEIPVVDVLSQGQKTIVRNFESIVNTLRRKPEVIIRYLTRELAVPARVEGPRLVLQGKFGERVLNERIKTFSEMYVICKECKRPDTKLLEAGRGYKIIMCEACGARTTAKL